ncbi:MAG: carboxypeptidase-like regulatory domain-containing protein [Leadbetterella sp.]|nr:carboxypeptidase-like regulatory domain-containing protein [Leadbetterella sp.]
MALKLSITYFLSILIFSNCVGQVVISGQILDSSTNSIVQNATILIKNYNSKKIEQYAFSDKNGEFKISLLSSIDSLTLEVRCLGYNPLILTKKNNSQILKLLLTQSIFELKEIIIEQEPIRKRGDTLVYSMGTFKDKNDRVIADVLKRLPGIEVEPNGRILYQGEPINKYYIEGLDLLNGRYKLANDNLNVDAVQSVEILENHQPIRMLDSLVFSEKAALNIRLKKKYSNTGQITAGAGIFPFLWDENITPMVFSKSFQMIGTLQANNVGKNIFNQTMQLTPGSSGSFNVGGNQKKEWVGIQRLSNPSFTESRWLDNNAKMGSLNILKKLKSGFEFRMTTDFYSDIQFQNGYTKSTFFKPETENVELVENKQNRLGFNSHKAELTIQKNTKAKYLKNSLKINTYWDNQLGQINGASGFITQKSQLPNFSVSNGFSDFIRIKKNILTLNSSILFEKTPQNLSVSPGSFIGLFNNGFDYERINQNVLVTKVTTENSVQTIRKILKISIESHLGFSIDRENLTSNISIDNFKDKTQVGDAFSNNLKWKNDKMFFKPILRYNIKNWKMSMNLPLTFNMIKAEDEILGKNLNLNKFVFEPKLSFYNEFKNFWNTNISINKSNRFSDINQIYFGYLLTNYREIKRYNAPIQQIVNYTGSVSLNYRNPINNIFGGISYFKTYSTNNIIFSNSINSNGSIEINALESNNISNTQSINGRIGKYIREIKTTASLKNSIIKQTGFQIINEKLSEVETFSIRPNFEINSNFSKWGGLVYSYNFSSFNNKIEKEAKPNANQQSHFLKLNLSSENNLFLSLNNEYYINNFNQQKNIFSDLILRKSIGKRKIDLELNWINIFNRKEIITINPGTFSYVETSYILRPSQGIFKVRFSY